MLLNGSKACIKTNGFVSEYFTLSRSIKQGCPVAPLLYVIQAEAMAAAIRNNPNIQGIKLPSHENRFLETRISQFVDDTQLFCKNEASLPHLFSNLANYEQASGAKMNKTKTTGLLIGSLRQNSHKFKEINWTRGFVKTLGVTHGYDIDNDAIWMEKIKKIKACLSVWKMQNVTYQGKVLVIKTFVISKILFEMENRGIPDKYANILENIIREFIWDKKQPLVCKAVAQLEKDMGGLSLPNITWIKKALNIKTVYKLINSEDQNWNAIGKFYLMTEDKKFGLNYFICQCSSLKGLKINKHVPLFYKNIINDWVEFRQKISAHSDTPLFSNNDIKFRKYPLFYESFTKSGICKVDDVLDKQNKQFLSDEELFRKLKSKQNWIAEWSAVKSSVTEYIHSNKKNSKSNTASNLKLKENIMYNSQGKSIGHCELKLKSVLQVYNTKLAKLECEKKWETTFDKSFDWKNIWKLLRQSKASLKAKQFHWKTIHHTLFTEHKLCLMGFSNGLCKFCRQNRETIRHVLWECPNAQSIWKHVLPKIETIAMNTLNYEIINPEINCLFGILCAPFKSKHINIIIFETKWWIWKRRNIYKHENKLLPEIVVLKSINNAVIEQVNNLNNSILLNDNDLVSLFTERVPLDVTNRTLN